MCDDLCRVIITGGRDFKDRDLLSEVLDELSAQIGDFEIISGHASGADAFAEEYAAKHGLQLRIFPAEWKKYGRAAGPIRNRQMLEYAKAASPMVIAFWDGQSHGTRDMIDKAREAEIDCRIHIYSN